MGLLYGMCVRYHRGPWRDGAGLWKVREKEGEPARDALRRLQLELQ